MTPSTLLNRAFGLRAAGTNVTREVTAGLTTFIATAYILLVNPAILAQAGIDAGAAFTATCLIAALGSALMGLLANYPIAVAPGMGLNAYFTYAVVLGMGLTWQAALGVTFIAATLFVALSVTPARGWIMAAIPVELKVAIAAGVGFFLVVIGLTNAGIVVDHPSTLVTLGDLSAPGSVIAAGAFLLIALLDARRVPGAVLIGIVAATAAGALAGLVEVKPSLAMPPDITPTLLALDLSAALDLALVGVIIGFLFVDLFDTSGTLFGLAHEGGFIRADGEIPRARRVLLADSLASLFASMLGSSPATAYVESSAGVRAGGRTGMVACVVALLFLASLFAAPLATAIPPFATGPALAFVGCSMASVLGRVSFEQRTHAVPAIVAALAMPLTYSVSTGIGLGIITWVVMQAGAGQARRLHPGAWLLATAFTLKFALL